MTRTRLLLATVAALLIATALLIWQTPQLVDWNRYRDTVAAVASHRLGRPVSIAGPIHLTLWPAPELTAEQVDIGGGGHDGKAGGFHVASLRLRVGLRPLLAGRIDARELVLRGADLRLPWPLPQAVLAARPPHWLGAFAARIEGGTLHLGNVTATDINATVTQGEDGQLTAAGTTTLDGRTGRFTFRLGIPDGEGAAALDATLDGMGQLSGTGAHFTGAVAPDGSLAGRVTARGTNLALLISAPPLPFHAEGRLTVGDGLAAMDEATFDLAGTSATGALALRLTPIARLDIALSATRFDLDPWLTVLLPAPGRTLGNPALPIGLDLAVEAARLGGGLVQRLRARADIEGGVLTVRDVTAVLPGDAELALAGSIGAARREAPRFVGTVRLDAPALRTTLRWLDQSGLTRLPLPAGPVLRTATFTAKLRTGLDSFALDGLTGRVDGAAVAGSLLLEGGAHPGFAIDVVTDLLALDAWLPADTMPAGFRSPAGWLRRGGLPGLGGGETARVAVRAEHATLRGLRINGLVLDASATAEGQLTVRELDGTARGLRLSVAGTVGPDGRVTDAKLSLTGPSAAPLATLAPSGMGTPALWKGPVALEIQGGGPPTDLALGIALDLADARLEVQPVVNLTTGAWHASATLRHPSAARLLGLLGLPLGTPPGQSSPLGTSGWLGDGSLSLVGQFSGTPATDGWGKLTADNVELTAGALRASGQLALDGRRISGTVAAEVLPVPMPDLASQTPLPLAALDGWHGSVHVQAAQVVAGQRTLLDNAAMTLSLGSDTLSLDHLTGTARGGALTGSAALTLGTEPPVLTASAALHDAIVPTPPGELPFGLLSGQFDGAASITASGYSPATLLATLAGSLHVTAHDGAVAGFDLFAASRAIGMTDARPPAETEQALRAAVQAGTTRFDELDIDGAAAHGLLRLTGAHLQGPAGSATAQGSIGLTDGNFDIRLSLLPSAPDSPSIGLRVDGPVDAPNRRPEMAAVARWLAERPMAH